MLRRLLEAYVDHHERKIVEEALQLQAAADKRVFLVAAAMHEWLSVDDLTPDELVRRGNVWLVKNYDLHPQPALMEAVEAFCNVASQHVAVRAQWPTICHEAEAHAARTHPDAAKSWAFASASNALGLLFQRCHMLVNTWRRDAGRRADPTPPTWQFVGVPQPLLPAAPEPAAAEHEVARSDRRPRVVRSRKNPARRRIVCAGCARKFSFGLSECPDCLTAYEYIDGKPVVVER